jgi:hypothetical protein
MRELAPVFGSVQEMQARTVEAELAKIDPQWRDFEPQMMSLLQEVPGLAKFPQRLYRLAVPPEVQEAKAMQAALAKLEGKGKHAAVAVKQGVSRSKPSPAKPKNFEEAWALAANQINQEG